MAHTTVTAELTAQATCPGIEEAIGCEDGWQVRDGAHWLVTREGTRIVTRRIDGSRERVFAEEREWNSPSPDVRGYASPARGGLIFSGTDALTAVGADGEVLWTHQHAAWQDDDFAQGACALTPSGRHVIATMCGPRVDGGYAGDVCVAFDAHTGQLVTQVILPSSSAGYMLQQLVNGSEPLMLSAAQGEEDYLSLLVTCGAGGLTVTPCGTFDDPFTGSSNTNGSLLKLSLGGESLTRWEADATGNYREVAEAHPDTLPLPGQQFVLRPGYIDDKTVIAPVAEKDDWAPEQSTHFLLDGQSLRVHGEVSYPFPVSPDPVALGDGTWLTATGDEIFRWRVAA
ncbi:hypothetical protein FCH28_24410 [Streptomyces piniterrae]|uniref:WD40 repeat domain-containing protein n=1 Tax=Streptomyces piniterrae TaxID=2571125 RepID=A0A4U0N6N9_9ACTN|nr:hypothetical protein [Streptomyces piniterrae]TJZ49459.1 hypothetical protein FCH28_24410 [Streptomyces piniterrae]